MSCSIKILLSKVLLHSAMNLGWMFTSVLLVISLSVQGGNSIYPHHLGFRLQPPTTKTEDFKPTPGEIFKKRKPRVLYCFVSNCDKRCSTKCIFKTTDEKASASQSTASATKQTRSSGAKKRSSTLGSFLQLVTEGLLKKIPLTALVTLTIHGDGRRGKQRERMQKITRVQ